jgi:hypothetical protein
MKNRIILLCILALLAVSCAPYHQLRPKVELSNAEQGYLELKKEKKEFELNKNTQYFVAFPAPREDNFYLVLNISEKNKFTSYFSNSLKNKKIVGPKIADESPQPESLSVYAMDTKSPVYYWLTDKIPQKLTLKLKYRYVPQWRFKFETKHAEYNKIFKENIVDRGAYKGIGSTTKLDGFDYALVIDTVSRHLKELEKVYNELLAIESIFPKSILNSQDRAYLVYKTLRSALEEEMNFQKTYCTVLEFFKKETALVGNPAGLFGWLDSFIAYFSHKEILSPEVQKVSQSAIRDRLAEALPFLVSTVSGNPDAVVFDPARYYTNSFDRLKTLYEKAELPVPAQLSDLARFVGDFNAKCTALAAVHDTFTAIAKSVRECAPLPPDDFFRGIVSRESSAQNALPKPVDASYGQFQNYKCSAALNQKISKGNAEISAMLGQYQEAAALVPHLNVLKEQKDYSTMLGLLIQKRNLDFLLDKYKEVDRMSLDEQSGRVRSALQQNAWKLAESGLKTLHADENYLNATGMIPLKESVVRDLEDSLYTGIDHVSRKRVNTFLEDKIGTLENVDSLYTDSVFLPAYDVTFSSGSKRELLQKKAKLVADLAAMKANEFPARAVKLLYEEFIKNPEDNGVLKARAIVTHGNHYKGEDKEIKLRLSECNPLLPKWIVKPKEYRRVFALPITDKTHGRNKYVVRLNVNIPTEAMFPVYDVNIKLPKEIAQNAAAAQWYDEIKLNKILLKNEGRFTITAPSASNDYECQITPVQMNKDQSNILEISFTAAAFKPFNISVMVQKPIIKKN